MPDDSTSGIRSAGQGLYTREEVIYGRKFGLALTMDVFLPSKIVNGAAIIFAVSEGWYSHHSSITRSIPVYVQPFVIKGWTIFAVCHGSNPKFSLLEILEDMHRSVRFIRHHAREYGIDPNRIGAMGDSAGGHLSLMLGCTGGYGNGETNDPVDGESSRVQAVVAFYPPTDFLNWGEPGKQMLGVHPLVSLKGAFDFHDLDPETNSFELIKDQAMRKQIGKMVSPISHAKEGIAPTLLIHGDSDTFIPLQQSEVMASKLQEAGVPSQLIVRKGGGHDEVLVREHISSALAWFETHLTVS